LGIGTAQGSKPKSQSKPKKRQVVGNSLRMEVKLRTDPPLEDFPRCYIMDVGGLAHPTVSVWEHGFPLHVSRSLSKQKFIAMLQLRAPLRTAFPYTEGRFSTRHQIQLVEICAQTFDPVGYHVHSLGSSSPLAASASYHASVSVRRQYQEPRKNAGASEPYLGSVW
jgi:hypothetical protein